MARKNRRADAMSPAHEETIRSLHQEIDDMRAEWRRQELARIAEWEHLPQKEAFALHNLQNSRFRSRRDRQLWQTKTCQLPGCDRETINLYGKSLGVCVAHGSDIVTYFEILGDRHDAMMRKADRLADELHRQEKWRKAEAKRAESRRTHPGWIYYLHVGEHIKIGFTTDVKRRLRSYPPGSPLLALHPGTKQLEHEMHAKFAGSKAAGREWFLDTPELRDHIKLVAAEFGEPDRARYEHHGTGRSKSRLKAS